MGFWTFDMVLFQFFNFSLCFDGRLHEWSRIAAIQLNETFHEVGTNSKQTKPPF